MNKYAPRFARTARKAALFIKNHDINRLPVNPLSIISQNKNWGALTYNEYALRFNILVEDVIEWAENADGCVCSYDDNKYLIFYNNDPLWVTNPNRIRWTLMHEIGHIILGHLNEIEGTRINKSNLTKAEYEQIEKEAHFFAACVLSPHIVTNKMGFTSPDDMVQICQISREAAEKRFKAYEKWKTRKKISRDDFIIFLQLQEFIHSKCCRKCNSTVTLSVATFCPICGQRLERRGLGKMIYDGITVNDSGRAKICPRCKDEEPHDKGDFCPICGIYLVNKCDDIMTQDSYGNEYPEKENCGEAAAGNARFCVNCGNPTTFYTQDFLCSWEEEKAKKEAAASIEEIPF